MYISLKVPIKGKTKQNWMLIDRIEMRCLLVSSSTPASMKKIGIPRPT